MSFDFGAILLVPFPFTDQTTVKRRPAVVVSSRAYNRARPDVVVMAVTSQLRASATFGEVWVSDWKGAGLLKPSAIKPIFATLEQPLILRRLGALATTDQAALNAAIAKILA
jgi:mRNA interferase MazF